MDLVVCAGTILFVLAWVVIQGVLSGQFVKSDALDARFSLVDHVGTSSKTAFKHIEMSFLR